MPRVILSLFDHTGIWSRPYVEAGYDVRRFDLQDGHDVRLLLYQGPADGILIAAPCTDLAGSGARWWDEKEARHPGTLAGALALVDAGLRQVAISRPAWWVLENPVGRLGRFIGPPRMYFHPHEYGGWPGGENDNYTKRTGLWGSFIPPEKRSIPPTDGSRMHKLSPSAERQNLRSATPEGFARAFFAANP